MAPAQRYACRERFFSDRYLHGDGPHRRAVRAAKLHGQQAEEGIGEVYGLQIGQVLGDDAARAEEEMVHRVTLGMWSFEDGLVYVEGVYRNGPGTGVHYELRCPAVEERVVVVASRAVVLIPAGAQDRDDALRETVFVGLQVLEGDPLAGAFAAHVHEERRAEEEPHIHGVYAFSAFYEVVRSVHMGPGVTSDVDAQDVDATACDCGRGLEAYCRIAWISLRAFVHPVGEIDGASHL